MISVKSLLALLLLCSCLVYGSLIDDILDAIEKAVDCGSCHALLLPLGGLALLGDSAFSGTVTAICKVLKIQDDDVCEGIIKQQGPILAHNLRHINPLGKTATKLCDSFGLCQPPAVNKYTVPFPKAAPTNPKVFVSKGGPTFQVSHFSDVHIDREYAPGSDVNCTKPICCRNYADDTAPPNKPAGPFGEHLCDTPTTLVQSMLQSIAANPNNAFSIFTGDLVEASVWLVNQTGVTKDMEIFNNEMATILKKGVYPTIGNHEAAPVNDFPRTTTKKANVQWIFDTQSKGWAKWIGASAADQVAHYSGSYSAVVSGTNLRIISINTVYWYKFNFWLYDSDDFQPDPNGIIAFVVRELQAAEDAGQRAWIIAHMPPGRQDTLNDQSNYFDQVIQRYRNTIAAQFYGHSHQDEFALAYSDYAHQSAANAVTMAYVAPSLTPRNGNPAYKVYDVDPDTYEIMDAKVYRSDLANPSFQTQPTWELYYSARATYGPLVGLNATSALTPAFWHRVTEAFAADATAFQQFNTFKNRGVFIETCGAECRDVTVCGLRALRAENNCEDSDLGLNFKKRAEKEAEVRAVHKNACGGAGLATVFSNLPNKITDEQRAAMKALLDDVALNA
ncbi:putative sphingomyelin phosphodiesterase asm-3 [Hypsizygus marmoreus]|uniref:Sphingomyelin phosphodiesterase n=1 Tax=Hypsizygus marmoreus TaxID=39966 RepID=A0A369K338_HYPMA|nr:putative sphingomyelin phosphodiesterase asm-3 [Hypsizygus marmoreus]